jgi:hypothetical protein
LSIIKRLYASGGPEIIYVTLEITDGVTTYWLLQGMEDLVLGGQLYQGVGIDVALPKRNASGMQDLTFAIDNTTGEVGRLLREALSAKRSIVVTLRKFTSDDVSVPALNPITFQVKTGAITNETANITAGYFDLLNTAWPRRLYDLFTFPGLTYL